MSDFGDASHKTAKKELNLAQDTCMELRDYAYLCKKIGERFLYKESDMLKVYNKTLKKD